MGDRMYGDFNRRDSYCCRGRDGHYRIDPGMCRNRCHNRCCGDHGDFMDFDRRDRRDRSDSRDFDHRDRNDFRDFDRSDRSDFRRRRELFIFPGFF